MRNQSGLVIFLLAWVNKQTQVERSYALVNQNAAKRNPWWTTWLQCAFSAEGCSTENDVNTFNSLGQCEAASRDQKFPAFNNLSSLTIYSHFDVYH